MGSPSQIANYNQFVKPPWMLGQFLGTTAGVEEILNAFAVQVTQLEAAAFGLMTGIMLANATGTNLDVIGRDLGLPRNGLTDAVYQSLLYVQTAVNASCGGPEDIITVLKNFAAGTNVSVNFTYPAKVIVGVDSTYSEANVRTFLMPVVPSGVGLGINEYLIDNNSNQIQDNNGTNIVVTVWN